MDPLNCLKNAHTNGYVIASSTMINSTIPQVQIANMDGILAILVKC